MTPQVAGRTGHTNPASSPEQSIIDLLTGFTTETTPATAAKIADYRVHLRPGATIFITFLPGSSFADTITVAGRLRREGFNPVPHFAARSIPSRTFLEESLARLTGDAGVDQALLIGGGLDRPFGEFSDTMQLLDTGLFDKYRITRIGVAGHPEGSPDIPDTQIRTALAWKNAFAERTGASLYVVTQFCFEAAPVIAWDKRIQAEGNRLPIHVGPSPASRRSRRSSAMPGPAGSALRCASSPGRPATSRSCSRSPPPTVWSPRSRRTAPPIPDAASTGSTSIRSGG